MIEDTGRKIVLQHMLVITGDDDKSMIIKHWRQDWEYEPARVLVYSANAGAPPSRNSATSSTPTKSGIGRIDLYSRDR